MHKLIPCTLLCSAALAAAGAPSDEQLLDKVRQRSTAMEEVTREPQRMLNNIALLCRPPSPQELSRQEANPHLDRESPEKWSRLYADKAGRAAAEGHEPFHPEGTVLIKEKTGKPGPDAKPELFTGMLKREKGFNPECGDWEFFTVSADAQKVTARGKLKTCMQCHQDYPRQDFTSRELVPSRLISSGADGSILLHSKDAFVFGTTMRYEPQPHKNTLGYWVKPEDTAMWTAAIPKGRYEVEVLQGCGKGSGGANVRVRFASGGLQGDQKVEFTVEDTGHFQNFKARTIGTVEFTSDSRTEIHVEPKSKPGPAVMDLRQIVLRPVKP